MFKEDIHEEVFKNRVNNHNIQIIKKFFVFQPNNQFISRPYASLTSKSKDIVLSVPKKNGTIFPGGFQQGYKSVSNNQQEEQSKPSIVLKSRKAPTNQISSFLLGMTSRINRQSQLKLAQQHQDYLNNNNISAERKINYEEIMTSLNKLKRQNNKCKYYSLAPTNNTSNSQTLSNQNQIHTELPLLQKRLTSPDRKSISTNIFTPNLSNKCNVPSYSSQQKKDNNSNLVNSNRIIPLTYSTKLITPAQEPCFVKGYLYYDPHARQFLQKNKQKILDQTKVKLNLQHVTAKNYLVVDRQSLNVIAEKNSNQQIEIASLTKIMTCYLCLLACRKYRVDPKQVQLRVSQKAEEMLGTSAELQTGDILTLKDLLYGLMLPSGNDASVVIAEAIGKIIQRNKKKPSKKTYIQTFLFHMNLLAKQLGIQQSFQNTSGLPANPNFSSPKAITILTAVAIKNPQFYQIINCKEYEVQVRNQRYGLIRKQSWKNTNKLLWKGWQGVKTGTTQSAGHCLMSCKGDYIISVFNCETLNKRFTESVKIYQYVSNLPNFSIIKSSQEN